MTMPEHKNIPYNLLEESFRIQNIHFYAPVPRHKHSCYELFYIIDGEGTFFMDCQNYDIQKQSLFLVSPGRIHGWEHTHNLHAYLLKFDHSIFEGESFLNQMSLFNFDLVHVNTAESAIIENTFATLEEEYLSTKSLKECTISSLLQILLIYIQRTLPVEEISYTSSTLFAQLNDLMHLNNYKIAKPSCYAHKLKTSTTLLNQALQEIVGKNAGEYIRFKTIQEAQRLLKYNPMTCNEIAYHLGFLDSAYFSRFFKREVGVSPKSFRETLS
ncbi:MAG: helix-turn-helix domain-containing protein [Sulfurospirillaceae bacterium]|nr:helix-turn-helix domain-containing protein [Sulfurospirillaceae bacterium]MDD2826777.1 helix-turn-helix domain-containing protein [Sulfurospirillaceae bacterium]